MAEKFLTKEETAQLLGISEAELLILVEQGKIPAYRIGGEFLRFEKAQIELVKDSFPKEAKDRKDYKYKPYPIGEKISDFFYFNDFYILAFVIIAVMLVMIFVK